MLLEIRHVSSLPKLAWCARVLEGKATVWAGPWIVAGDNWFAEGAWDGPLTEGSPDTATCQTGSSGVVRGGSLVLCAPSDTIEHLYSVRRGKELIVSNSLVFLAENAGIELDRTYRQYGFDLVDAKRMGIRDKHLLLRGGIEVHTAVNLVIDSRGRIRYERKPQRPVPVDYAGVVDLLVSTMTAVLENAADPIRPLPFRPVVSLSGGYDSTAIAALARRLGCTEAVTTVDGAAPHDSGTPIARVVGMQIKEFSREVPGDLAIDTVAEFLAAPFGVDLPKAVMEDELAATILMIGHQGDQIFGKKRGLLPDYGNPGHFSGSGGSMVEFRLRAGFQTFLIPAIAARFSEAVYQITMSPEMEPFIVGGSYDRPIPRRIAEEAGVPRSMFGRKKSATGHSWASASSLPRSAVVDFEAWAAEFSPELLSPLPSNRLLRKAMRGWRRWLAGPFGGKSLRLRRWLRTPALRWWRRSHRIWDSPYLLMFQWAVERLRRRYRIVES